MHRFPFSCVSIGLTIAKQPVVGVVFNPILNEMYHAGALRMLRMLWACCGHTLLWPCCGRSMLWVCLASSMCSAPA